MKTPTRNLIKHLQIRLTLHKLNRTDYSKINSAISNFYQNLSSWFHTENLLAKFSATHLSITFSKPGADKDIHHLNLQRQIALLSSSGVLRQR